MKIYVGNLSFNTSEDSLQRAFEEFGQVEKTIIVKDKQTGKPRGFGFVEMASDEEARTAIAELNDKELDGRRLRVTEARPREASFNDRRSSGGSSSNGGGYHKRF